MKELFLFLVSFLLVIPTFAEDMQKPYLDIKIVYSGLYYDDILLKNFDAYSGSELYIGIGIKQVNLPENIKRSEILHFVSDNYIYLPYEIEEPLDTTKMLPLTSESFRIDIGSFREDYEGRDYIGKIRPYIKEGEKYKSIGSEQDFYYFLSKNGKYLHMDETGLRNLNTDISIYDKDRQKYKDTIVNIFYPLSLLERSKLKDTLLKKIKLLEEKSTNDYKQYLGDKIKKEEDLQTNKYIIEKYIHNFYLLNELYYLVDRMNPQTGELEFTEEDLFLEEMLQELK